MREKEEWKKEKREGEERDKSREIVRRWEKEKNTVYQERE